ncbi:HAMP domain-containing histidine kinase [Mucilaginibacter roseus]|uniref:histidine kinase n=1 Tax=Mucilaginibacter roseus TaxID=1528868 RepID=A0ABS8U314_9SPHI|nr:HAMP domain-containing sensor histidine kinase [Mucilaginibacter roseus]MCD8741037.1 HAMP domain-containing histidine kinase [Mucilaginibacter roseus]
MRFILLLFLLTVAVLSSCKGQSAADSTDTTHVTTYHSITDSAKAFASQLDTEKALHYHKRALTHARRHDLHEHQAHALVNIALLLKDQNADQSLIYLDSALKIAEDLDKKDLRAHILMAISSVHKEQQNYKESLAALEAHQKLLRAVFEENKRRDAARVHAQETDDRKLAVLITILIAVGLIAIVFAFYIHRIKRLNKALHKSNHIKDTLFSIIGHDLRGPAGGIMQALELVDAGVLTEKEEKEIISLLKQQSRSFNETLNTLLNWASAQLKGAEPKLASVDAMTAIQKSLDLLRAQAIAKNIEINAPHNNGLPVLADSDQLDFIMRNLISNAIKFSYPGGKIAITTETKTDTAVIAVHDDGKGIPADKQAELFTEGRLDSTYGTSGEKGTGLGLMLSWDFIKANRGRMWCDSKEGAGTTFYVSFPLPG